MVVFMRSKGFGPVTTILIKALRRGLIREKKGDGKSVWGGDVFIIDEGKGVDDG